MIVVFRRMQSQCLLTNTTEGTLPACCFKSRWQQHRASLTQSVLCVMQPGHYALQPALQHPAAPFTSQPTSPTFLICCFVPILLHCLHRTQKASQGLNKFFLPLQEEQMLLRQEVELTAVAELSTFAPWMGMEACGLRQMVLGSSSPLPTHICLHAH